MKTNQYMNQTTATNNKKNWYVGKWPLLAWLETFIKVLAITIGIFALSNTFRSDILLAFPTGFKLVQLIIQAVLTLGLVAAIFDRIQVAPPSVVRRIASPTTIPVSALVNQTELRW